MLRFLIVFLFSIQIGFGQDPDTLLRHILQLENDTEKVNQLYTIGFDLIDKDPKLAWSYAQHCESTAKKTGSLSHVSKSYNLSGILFYKQGYFKKAAVYFENYLSSNKILHNVLGMAYGLTNLGNAYLQLKEFQRAENYYLQALEHYNFLNNKTFIANSLINLGVLKQEQDQLDAASENYEKAFAIGKELNDYEIRSICLNNLAQIFFEEGNYDKALAYNYDALELRELMGLDGDRADSYLSISEVALEQNNLELAVENLNSALQLCNKFDYTEGKMMYHKLASELYSRKNDYRSAYENLKLYTQLNDSLLILQEEEPIFELEESEESNNIFTGHPIKNVWMLISLSLLLIIIPAVLMRYKR